MAEDPMNNMWIVAAIGVLLLIVVSEIIVRWTTR
jgi:hypothetical protein